MNERLLDLADEMRSPADAKAYQLGRHWHLLCERYLPIKFEHSIWRQSRESKPQDPPQGWKLHISATIFEACDLF